MNCHTTTAKSEWRLTMTNNQLTRKQRAAVVRRQKITLAAGIAVLILVIIFVLAFKGCNSKKKNNDKTVPANTETTTDDNKTTTENNSENRKHISFTCILLYKILNLFFFTHQNCKVFNFIPFLPSVFLFTVSDQVYINSDNFIFLHIFFYR